MKVTAIAKLSKKRVRVAIQVKSKSISPNDTQAKYTEQNTANR